MALKQLEFQLSTRHFPIPSDNKPGLGNSWWFSSPRPDWPSPSPFSSPFVEAQHGLVAVVPELLKEASEAWLQCERQGWWNPPGWKHPVVGALKIAAGWYMVSHIPWIPYGFHALGDTVSIISIISIISIHGFFVTSRSSSYVSFVNVFPHAFGVDSQIAPTKRFMKLVNWLSFIRLQLD